MRELDVVIGAGVTGLTAATDLARAGRSVVVLEARDRVGGRLWTDQAGPTPLELGGQWISPDQTALLAMLEELGLDTFARHRDGACVYVGQDGERRTFEGSALPVSPQTRAVMDRLTATLDELAGEMDPARPWDHRSAVALDRISFAAWLDAQSDDKEAKDNIGLYVGPAMLTKATHEFSALTAVMLAASAGSFSNLLDADFILDRRVVGGMQQIPLQLADALGDRVVTDSAVDRVEWSLQRAVVHSGDRSWTAEHVIVAVPPTLVQRIQFAPALPPMHMQWRQHQSFGMVIKVQASYVRPFWRRDGLSGTAFSPYLPVHEAYDNTGFGDELGTLVGFVSDVRADGALALTAADRKALFLQSFAAYFGDQALAPVAYSESQWEAEEWTAGAYGASFGLGGLTRYGALIAEQIGPVSFGTSDVPGPSYLHVDGAIRVGHRLAQQVIG